MKRAIGRAGFTTVVVLGVILSISLPIWGGGNSDEPDSHQDDGPSYFGFVKDTSGKVISDAKVTAEIKGRGSVITRSDATGIYKLPGFGKQVTPNNVIISCSKDGYRQTRILRRPAPAKKPVTAIETECTMQRAGAK
jgi:hypothetical protein